MRKRKTLEQFLKEANEVHNYIYDYSQVDYRGALSPITIICRAHGSFKQEASSHLSGSNCPVCVKKDHKTYEYFLAQAKIIHGDTYIYDKVKYKNQAVKVIITCRKHGDFKQKPQNHLNQKQGCLKCFKERKFSNTQDFIEKANKIHNNIYDYSKVNYIDAHTKVKIICRVKNHGLFEQRPNNHLKGEECPKCFKNISKAEIAWLDSLNIPEEYRHKIIKLNNKKFYVDAYNPILNIIYEFYGDYWHGNPLLYSSGELNKIRKITHGELYQKTMERETILKEAGWTIISIWENDWNKIKKINKANNTNE